MQVVFRTATQDTELARRADSEGRVRGRVPGLGEPRRAPFPRSRPLDIDRERSGFPGFGFGKHFCLGASLARLETRVAFEALVPELVQLERSEPTIARVESFLVRGPKRLAVQRAA